MPALCCCRVSPIQAEMPAQPTGARGVSPAQLGTHRAHVCSRAAFLSSESRRESPIPTPPLCSPTRLLQGWLFKKAGRLLAQSHMPLSSVWATCPCPVLSCIFWGPPQRPPKGPLLPTPRGVFHVQVKILDQFMALVWGEDRPRRLRRWFRVLSTAPGSDLSPLPTSLFCPV